MDKILENGKLYILKEPEELGGSIRYVGKYEQKNLNDRLKKHFAPSTLKIRSHRTNWLKSLLNQNLKPQIELIQDGYKSRKELCDAEIWLIAFYKEIGLNLVNTTAGGEGTIGKLSPQHCENIRKSKTGKNNPNFGKPRSQEVIEKMRKSNIGKKRSLEQRINFSIAHGGKGPFVCEQTGEIFQTQGQAAEKLDIYQGAINAYLNGKGRPVNGYTFKYLDEKFYVPPLGPKKNSQPFICNETGEIFCSLGSAAKKLNLSNGNIKKVLSGDYAQIRNLTFKYLDDKLNVPRNKKNITPQERRIKHSIAMGGKGPFVCNETQEIFQTQSEAADKLGLQQSNVGKVLRGTYKQTGGYTFKYI